MIHAEYVEFDQPTGARVRSLEVFGHAGYAPRGQDIVCAGASMLMETLVYVLADCDEAECCAYNEPTGPRVSVKLTGSIFPTDLTAMEFAKTGLALLAERYPENIHYEDKSKDGQEKMVNLQLFAEGCGDGGAAAAAASAADAAQEVQEPALRPAEERLARRSGVLKRSSREEGSPSQSAQSAASSPEGGALGSEEKSELDEEAAENQNEVEGKDGEEKGEGKTKSPEERRKAFGELLRGEYADLTEELMQNAVTEATRRLEASPAMKGLMQALQEKYGTDANDLVALTEAVRNGAVKDDAYYEKLAMEKGVSTRTARELDKLESQNKHLTEQQQMIQQMERQRAQQARIAELQAGWDREAEQLKAQYPDFNMAEVLANPEVEKMMRSGVSMTNAYRSAYFDHILKQQQAATARQVEQGVVNRMQQRNARPGENGTRPGGAVQTKIDVSHMSRKEMEEMEKRVMRGEVITL
ncbi:ribosomal-processing cysteine protease Prp [Faecalibacterium prausnitzii]|uniref:Ribosomal processing cysteine protease Prp n=1 Tax=Faecalibacterium prausnitzii TaxID=853 RepID=A0A844DRV7_9FIRM|nr:ribosomal-processing cysteine protease Prp [Faecalibacterium prausnitzii]MSC63150.1 ribosomal-processing cysteine protease Prp [Faecalibacterium prausnitzii]